MLRRLQINKNPISQAHLGMIFFNVPLAANKICTCLALQIQLKNNTTPLFDWGKYWEKDVRIMVPISVQTHYSFIDGIHIGEFVDSLEKYFASF